MIDKVAILVDGDFYLRRARHFWGEQTGEERAKELHKYCTRHLRRIEYDSNNIKRIVRDDLYRIFFYDCHPSRKQVFNPLTKKTENLAVSKSYLFRMEMHEKLTCMRKVALRFGELREASIGYTFDQKTVKSLLMGKMQLADITQNNMSLSIAQKGVDMRIGLDIASLAYKKQVTKIVLISGDADFVPAAKLARREGIDFVLDPMGNKIAPSLNEHIDGLRSHTHGATLHLKPDVFPQPDFAPDRDGDEC